MQFTLKKVRVNYKDKKTGDDRYFYHYYLVATFVVENVTNTLTIRVKSDDMKNQNINEILLRKFAIED